MDWSDIEYTPKIIKITEQVYRGIQCKHVEGKGWKIVIGDEEYLFPNWQEAQRAIDRIHNDCENWYGGVKLKKSYEKGVIT